MHKYFKVRMIPSITMFLYLSAYIVFTEGNSVINIFRICIVAVFGLLCFKTGIRKKSLGFVLWGVGFVILNFISILWAINKQVAYDGAMTILWNYICVLFIFTYCISNKGYSLRIIKMFMYVPIVWVIFTIMRFGMSGLINVRQFMTGSAYNRAGLLAAYASIVAYFYAREKTIRSRDEKNKYWFFATLNFLICVLSTSRKSIIVTIVGVLSREILYSKNSRKVIKNVIIGCIVVVGLWIVITRVESLNNLVGKNLTNMFNGLFVEGSATDSSTFARINRIDRGLNWFKMRPWFGYGSNNYSVLSGIYRAGFEGIADNNFVELLVNLGIVGLLMYYCFVTRMMVNAIRIRFDNPIAFTLLVCLLISDFGSSNCKSSFALLIIALCIDMTINLKQVRKNEQPKQVMKKENIIRGAL